MPGDDRQTIAVTQWTMPAMHIRAAERRSGYAHQQGARFQIGNGDPLYFQRLIMGSDDGSAAVVHFSSPSSSFSVQGMV